ncbi:MAG: ester cyclase, partial [Mycobacterium sp.]
IGINNFRIDEVVGDEKAAIYRWTWNAPTAAAFVGVPTNGKVPGTRGITFHIYDSDGRIKREESFWDCASAVRDLGLPVDSAAVAKSPALV